MYKHEIKECMDRVRKYLAIVREFHRAEDIEFFQQKLDSYQRLYDNAYTARMK